MEEHDALTEVKTKDQSDIDPAMIKMAMERFAMEQNLPGAIVAGLIATILGAGIWAAVTVLIGYQIGWMAVGVGFLIGITIRKVGKGIEKTFGIAGAVLALLGCILGNIFSICYLIAQSENISFFEVISKLNPLVVFELMKASFSPIDLLFYGLAIYEGYRLSFRQISEEDLERSIRGLPLMDSEAQTNFSQDR